MVMMNIKRVPTTVKLNAELYDELKILSIRHKFTLQSFVEKCIYLYVYSGSFKDTINNFQMPVLQTSGSI